MWNCGTFIKWHVVFADGYLCAFDWVEVFSGNDTSAPSQGKFCGYTAPQPMSNLGSIHVQFVTDYMITDKGWVINYETSGMFNFLTLYIS